MAWAKQVNSLCDRSSYLLCTIFSTMFVPAGARQGLHLSEESTVFKQSPYLHKQVLVGFQTLPFVPLRRFAMFNGRLHRVTALYRTLTMSTAVEILTLNAYSHKYTLHTILRCSPIPTYMIKSSCI